MNSAISQPLFHFGATLSLCHNIFCHSSQYTPIHYSRLEEQTWCYSQELWKCWHYCWVAPISQLATSHSRDGPLSYCESDVPYQYGHIPKGQIMWSSKFSAPTRWYSTTPEGTLPVVEKQRLPSRPKLIFGKPVEKVVPPMIDEEHGFQCQHRRIYFCRWEGATAHTQHHHQGMAECMVHRQALSGCQWAMPSLPMLDVTRIDWAHCHLPSCGSHMTPHLWPIDTQSIYFFVFIIGGHQHSYAA